MSKIVRSILNRSFKKEKLDILCVPIHERYESNLCRTGHNFWAWRGPQVKDWNTSFAPIPKNYNLLNPDLKEHQIPLHVDLDLIISGNKFGAFQILSQYAKVYNIPIISVEHTAPHPDWPKGQIDYLKSMKGDVNIFISEWSRKKWGWNDKEAKVIHHGIDVEMFRPISSINKKQFILTTVNEYSKPVRHWCCGWPLYEEVTKDLPRLNVGNDAPLSLPAKSTQELVKYHNECSVFLNTASFSPFPMSLFEAMACGSICVSLPSCMVPEVIEHGYNGLLVEKPNEMRSLLMDILENRQKYEHLGVNARKTIVERFHINKFIENWNKVLNDLCYN